MSGNLDPNNWDRVEPKTPDPDSNQGKPMGLKDIWAHPKGRWVIIGFIVLIVLALIAVVVTWTPAEGDAPHILIENSSGEWLEIHLEREVGDVSVFELEDGEIYSAFFIGGDLSVSHTRTIWSVHHNPGIGLDSLFHQSTTLTGGPGEGLFFWLKTGQFVDKTTYEIGDY